MEGAAGMAGMGAVMEWVMEGSSVRWTVGGGCSSWAMGAELWGYYPSRVLRCAGVRECVRCVQLSASERWVLGSCFFRWFLD